MGPLLLTVVVMSLAGVEAGVAAAPVVTSTRVPDGGVQPQVAVDERGTVHLIYMKGPEKAADIFYARTADGGRTWSQPLRVNSRPGAATVMGNIRGARLAVGKNGRAHVVWNGATTSMQEPAALWYTCLDDAGRAFRGQRNLMTTTEHLDGGACVAADDAGSVYVYFHAAPKNAPMRDESSRRVYLAASRDEGRTFAAERPIDEPATGVCACCSVTAFIDARRQPLVLYRAVIDRMDRDMRLLIGDHGGDRFTSTPVHPWKVNRCPMSMSAITATVAGDPLIAWETDGQVHLAKVDMTSGRVGEPIAPPGSAGKRKFPVLATNKAGQTLMAWTEGMGWNKGGSAAWQVFDADGKPIPGAVGKAPGVPVWSLVAAFTGPDGSFVIVY